MSKVLVIDGHPDPQPRLCHALAASYVEGARDTGNETRLIRLADADFPLLRSAAEFAEPPQSEAILNAREDIAWADHLVLVFPLWMGAAPAYLSAFLEQTARGGFLPVVRRDGDDGGLRGKSARLIVTTGRSLRAPCLAFRAPGVHATVAAALKLGGARPVRATFLGGADKRDERSLPQIRALGAEVA